MKAPLPIPGNLPIIAANPKLIGELCNLIGSMPNIETSTMGGKVFWDTLESYEGWSLQRNKLTNHYRLLNPEDRRVAWGSETAMLEALKRFNEKYGASSNETNNLTINKIDELSKLANLYKEGSITQDEFEVLKKQIISN